MPEKKTRTPGDGGRPRLLSGGNPQIPKGYGDAPVQAFIAAMPGWKSAVGRRIDELVEKAVPDVCKAVKWNSPFYGLEKDIWFLSFHVYERYVKIAFFRGKKLDPMPPVDSKNSDTRYLHVHEDEDIDEKQFLDWVKQSTRFPGEKM